MPNFHNFKMYSEKLKVWIFEIMHFSLIFSLDPLLRQTRHTRIDPRAGLEWLRDRSSGPIPVGITHSPDRLISRRLAANCPHPGRYPPRRLRPQDQRATAAMPSPAGGRASAATDGCPSVRPPSLIDCNQQTQPNNLVTGVPPPPNLKGRPLGE